MNLEVKIDAKEINREVSQAILDSVIGETIKKGIEQQFKNLEYPIHKIIEQEICRIAKEIIIAKYTNVVADVVAKKINNNLKELVDQAWERILRTF